MARKSKFKSAARGRQFQSPSARLQASRGELEKDTQRKVDALELQALQLRRQNQTHVAGLANAAEFEEQILKKKHQLEQSVRTRKYEALQKKAETHVQALRDEAKAKKDHANYLAELAPKQAKAAQEFFTGVSTLTDTMVGINQFNALKESGFLQQIVDGKADAHYKIVYDATNSTWKVTQAGDAEGANALTDRTIRLSSHWAQKKFASWVNDNKEMLRNDVIANFEARDKNGLNPKYKYGEDNAVQAQEFGALGLLKRLGISNNSKVGASIVDTFSAWGAQDKKGFFESRKVKETQERINDLNGLIETHGRDSREGKLAFNHLVLAYKNGWHKSTTGKVLNPNAGGGKYATIAEAVEAAGMSHLEKGISSGAITSNNIGTYFDSFATFPDPNAKPTDKTETWPSRFPEVFERLEQQGWDLLKKKNEDEKVIENAKGDTLVNEVQVDIDAALANDGYMDPKERYKILQKIQNYEGTNDSKKQKAYNLIDYNPSGVTEIGQYQQFWRAYSEGNTEEAFKIYSSLSANTRRQLSSHVQALKDLNQIIVPKKSGNNGTMIRGLSALYLHDRDKLKGDETNGNLYNPRGILSETGESAAIHRTALYLEHIKNSAFIQDKQGNYIPTTLSLAERQKAAEDFVNKLWNEKVTTKWVDGQRVLAKDGTTLAEGSPGYNPDNPFNRDITDRPKTPSGGYIYYNQKPDNDGLQSRYIESILKSGEDGNKLTTALRSVLDTDSKITIKPENVSLILEHEAMSVEELLKNPRLVNGSQIKPLADYATQVNRAIADPGFGQFAEATIPNLPPVYSAILNSPAGKQWSVSRLAQAHFKRYNHRNPNNDKEYLTFPDTPRDACLIKHPNGVKSIDEQAYNIYEACKVQGVQPLGFAAQYSLDGLDMDATFFKLNPGTESDQKAFFEAGGLFKTKWGEQNPVHQNFIKRLGMLQIMSRTGNMRDPLSVNQLESGVRSNRKKKTNNYGIPNKPYKGAY